MVTSEEKVLREAVREYWQSNHSFNRCDHSKITSLLEKEYLEKNIFEGKLLTPFLWSISRGYFAEICNKNNKIARDEALEQLIKKIQSCLDIHINRYANDITKIYTYALRWYNCKPKFLYDDIDFNDIVDGENKVDASELIALKEENDELRKMNNNLKELCQEEKIKFIQEKNILTNKLSAIEQEKEALKKEYQENTNKWDRHIQQLRDEKQQLEDENKQRSEEIDNYQNQIEELNRKINKLQNELLKERKKECVRKIDDKKYKSILNKVDWSKYNLFSEDFMSFDNSINAIQNFASEYNFSLYGCMDMGALTKSNIKRLAIRKKDFGDFIGCNIDEYIFLVPVPKREYGNMWHKMHKNIFNIKMNDFATIMTVKKPLLLHKDTLEILSQGELEFIEEQIQKDN